MKYIIALAFVLAATLAHASGDPAPKGRQAMAKSPPVVITPASPGETREVCQARIKRECEDTRRTRLFTASCIRRNVRYHCR